MSQQSFPPQPPSDQQPPGWGQPQGPAWGAPPPPPKKNPIGKILGFGCLGIVGLVVVIGIIGAVLGGSSSDTSDKPAASSGTKTSSAPQKTSAADEAGPEGDVKITACVVDSALHWPSAKLTITNRSSKASNYMIELEFVDAKGTRISEGIAATNNLAPGQAAKETAQGTADASGKITCKVTKVTRYAS